MRENEGGVETTMTINEEEITVGAEVEVTTGTVEEIIEITILAEAGAIHLNVGIGGDDHLSKSRTGWVCQESFKLRSSR